ncbi:MAG TPA: sigma-70 family RNA polymerase sigma factor [Thermoguttaceae bacterium]
MNRHERLNDELLVLRCQEGDAEAFEALVGRWQERLWRHARRLTGDENTAWDVLQEGWIGICRGLNRLVDPAAFPAWAYQIISNKCRDRIRREKRYREAAELYSERIYREQTEAIEVKNQYATLKEALEHLPGHVRAILSLRYEEGFDTAEIAAILGVPDGTVKSRLFHARQKLSKYLEVTGNERAH